MNEWVTECATHIFPSKNQKFTHPENMFLSFYLDGWSVPRRALGNVRFWRCRQRADGPTRVTDQPPMLRSDLPRKQNLRTQCSREDCDQGISPSVESDPEEMRRVTVESSLHFMSHLNSIVSMTSTVCWVCFEASGAIRQQFFSEVSHHGNSDSIFVMYCVSVPVLSEPNMSKPQV